VTRPLLLAVLLAAGCSDGDGAGADGSDAGPADVGGAEDAGPPANPAAGDLVLYELQVRSANACDPTTGGDACATRLAPVSEYQGPGCGSLDELRAIRKGTLDDLLAEHDPPHRTAGITLQYADEVVGANAVWLLPVFPHDAREPPEACDDLGSPWAVRDHLHVRGSLAVECAGEATDEDGPAPCRGDAALAAVIEAAHARGLKVVLDLAVMSYGPRYHLYGLAGVRPVREWLAEGTDLKDLDATFEDALVWPEVIDTPGEMPTDGLGALMRLCDSIPEGAEGVRRWLMWREASEAEREAMDCEGPATLQAQLPGLLPGSEAPDGGMRLRERLFRLIDVWLARGVDGLWLSPAGGLSADDWRYVLGKARHYQQRRGLPEPVFLGGGEHATRYDGVFDVLAEGWRHDVTRGRRQASDLETLLFGAGARARASFPLLRLEGHDAGRLLEEATGLDAVRGVTLHAVAAASRGALLVQAGQEWAAPWAVETARSDYLRGRFPGEANWDPDGDALTARYRTLHATRQAPAHAALREGTTTALHTADGEPQLLAFARHLPECGGAVLAFHRLWADVVDGTFAVPPELAERLCLPEDGEVRLVDALSGEDFLWGGRTGADLCARGLPVRLDAQTPYRWLRLEGASQRGERPAEP